MNSLNPFDPGKQFRITYKGQTWYADKVDYSKESGVLTTDGAAKMIFHPEQLSIMRMDEVIS